MSFILDAIAKSERERQQQEVPDARILAIPVGETARSRWFMPFMLVVALLVTIVVLLIWLQTDRQSSDRLSQMESNNIQRSPLPDTMSSMNGTPNFETDGAPAPLTSTTDVVTTTSQSVAVKSAIPAQDNNAASIVVPKQFTTRVKENTTIPAEKPQASAKDQPEKTSLQQLEKTEQGESNSTAASVMQNRAESIDGELLARQTAIQNVVEPTAREVLRLSELPADVRGELPPVAFTGHLYSTNTKVSYVMVDGGRSVVAGQQIAGDLFLHEVTPEGAIVDFKGFLIDIGILQNWSLQ